MRVARFWRLTVATLLAVVAATVPALAEKRVALVIGNGAYERADRLSNPVTDSRNLHAALKRIGFAERDIVYGENLGKRDLERAIGRFATLTRDADVAIAYYAGHGATFGDTPYVVPVDARFDAIDQMPYELTPLENMIGELRRAKGVRIAIVDACRDNSAERELKRLDMRGGENTRGLAPPRNPEGLIVAYATQYLSTAADGPAGGDSPFTAALLKHLPTPGLDVKDLFFEVGREVLTTTQGRQRPEVKVSFYEKYSLVPGAASPPPAVATPAAQAQDEIAWSMIEGTSDPKQLENFIARFPESPQRGKAIAALDDLKRRQTAALAPAASASQQPISWASPTEPPSVQRSPPPPPQQQQVATVTPVAPPPIASGPCGGVTLASLGSRRASPLSANEECALQAKAEFQECESCPVMVVVPAGTFTMGSPEGEEGRDNDEGPLHKVTIRRSFAVGKFEVTFDEWDACFAEGGCGRYRPRDKEWGRGRRPVINVSWKDAQAYSAWLSKKTGKTYRLLSEAEWEYSARAGTSTPFWQGSSISTQQANYNGAYSYGEGKKGDYRSNTVAVDSFAPNPFGLYQTQGNVWEWVEDCYHENYRAAPSDGSAWTAGDCSRRTLRGGSWLNFPRFLRAAGHIRVKPDYRGGDSGFRLARTLIP